MSTGGVEDLAAQVRSGSRSAREVAEEALGAIEDRDDELSAFLHVAADEARRVADGVDSTVRSGDDPGPLAGVPVAVKDNFCTAGVPTTCGSKILDGWRPPYSATAVRRLMGAGAVIVGKTNLDEFAMGSSTENSAFGATRNPHDLDRVPGGSSGGSAAAVGADLVSLAYGSDTGGSIRQPASFCGVVGVKPTYGAVSRYGLVAFASSLDQIGPIGSNVRDAAVGLEVVAGHDPADSTSIHDEAPDLVVGLEDGVEGLRVGLIRELTGVEGVAPDVSAATANAAAALEAAGAHVDEVSVPSAEYALSAYYLLAPAEASSNLARFDGVRYGLRVDADEVEEMNRKTRAAGFGAEVKRRIMLGTYALSAGYYDAYYGRAQRVRTLVIREFQDAYADHDVLLSPTSPTTAFAQGERVDDPLSMYLSDVCTVASNLSGDPAMSVPFGVDAAGLPIGVQVLAPALGEPVMFRTARAIEQAAPSADEQVGT